jgi:hypothetical protein
MIRPPPIFFASLASEDNEAGGTSLRTALAIALANSRGGTPSASASSSTRRSTSDRGHHDLGPYRGEPSLQTPKTNFHIEFAESDTLLVTLNASTATMAVRKVYHARDTRRTQMKIYIIDVEKRTRSSGFLLPEQSPRFSLGCAGGGGSSFFGLSGSGAVEVEGRSGDALCLVRVLLRVDTMI